MESWEYRLQGRTRSYGSDPAIELLPLKRPKATLSYRSGYRFLIDPPPTIPQADSISNEMKEAFNQWQYDYKKVVANATDVDSEKLHFEQLQEVRIRNEGNTRVIDYPLLMYKDGINSFDTRVCAAICTDDTSTKIWSRASLPIGIDGTVAHTKIDYLQKHNKLYRDVTSHSIDWMSSKIPMVLSKHLDNVSIEQGRRINIIILGVDDERLAKPLIDLSEQERTIAEIVADSDLDNILTSYYRNICDIDVMLSDYVNNNNRSIEPSLLFKFHLGITTSSRYMERRTVLFLLREKKEETEIVGLAYDDSVEMDIPLKAGPQLTQTIGPWI